MEELKKLLEGIQIELGDIKTSQKTSAEEVDKRFSELEEKFKSSEATGGSQTGNIFGISTNTASYSNQGYPSNSHPGHRSYSDHSYGHQANPHSPPLCALWDGFGSVGSDVVQADFKTLQDSYSKQKLPGDCKLNDSRTGIKKEQQSAAQVVGKCARYVECSMRILKTVTDRGDGPSEDEFKELILCQMAHMRYLQERYAGLVVGSSFGKQTQDVFMSIQNNSSVFTPQVVDNVKAAIQLTNTQSEFAGRGRDSNRGNRGGRGNRGYNNWGDNWNNYGNYGNHGNRGRGGRGFNSGSGRSFPPAERDNTES